jgi:hypothetical protein
VASSIGAWYTVLSQLAYTYKSGDWSSGTDMFVHAPFALSGSLVGLALTYQCSSPTSCTARAYDDTDGYRGRYNLIYVYLDDGWLADGSYSQQDKADVTRVSSHELGHGFGLNHAESCLNGVGTIMFSAVFSCATLPQGDDAAAVRAIYPEM